MLKISLVLIMIGVLFLLIENIFYQHVDESGLLHESLFLPIGVILLLVGATTVIMILIKRIINKIKD